MNTIELDLSRHCIETETRRCYDQTISHYFKSAKASFEDQEEIEQRLELLQTALETFDFNGLRNRFPELCGGSAADVKLRQQEGAPPFLSINGHRIDPCRVAPKLRDV